MKPVVTILSIAAAATFTQPAFATFFNNSAGLNNPDQTVDFESAVLAVNESVTNEFAGFGVTFDNAFANPDLSNSYPNINGNRIGNFRSNVGQSGLFTVHFSNVLSEVAFAMVTAPGTSTFRALLNGAEIDSVSAPTTFTSTVNFFGFRGITFDAITISVVSGDHALLLDSLQTVSAIPEPKMWALLLSGLILFILGVKQKRL